jgi:hypothetical protein
VRLKVTALPGFRQDIAELPNDKVRKRALEVLGYIANGLERGAPLDARVSTGDLSECRKVYFDLEGHRDRPRFRLVVRLLPNEAMAVTVEAVAVGRRANLDAYARAIQNLADPPPAN